MLKKLLLAIALLSLTSVASANTDDELVEVAKGAVILYLLENDAVLLQDGVNAFCEFGENPSEVHCELPGHDLTCNVTIHDGECHAVEPDWEEVIPTSFHGILS